MRVALFASFVLLAAPSLAQQSAPEIQFDSAADFLKLPPGTNFGEVSVHPTTQTSNGGRKDER
jgi:hypothetical protein